MENNETKLRVQLHGIDTVLDELRAEYDKGTIDVGRYFQMKAEHEARRAEIEFALKNLLREKQQPAAPKPSRPPTGLSKLYYRGKASLRREKYRAAMECLQQVVKAAPNYRDAAKLLAAATARQHETARLAELYDAARELCREEAWQEVWEIFTDIHAIDAHYPDPDGLLATARTPPRIVWEKDGKEMMLIPTGEFIMGSTKEEVEWAWELCNKTRGGGCEREWFECEYPQHTIHLDAYYIDRCPVTNAEYKRFVDETGHRAPNHWENGDYPRGKADHPVVYVAWSDATAYAEWAGKRLPTEAEWEKAARGIDGRKWPWGNEWDKSRCNAENNIGDTTSVGKYSPHGDSPYGVADLGGNVWEWCADWYDGNYYANAPNQNPCGPGFSDYRVVRGGAFSNLKYNARCAYRSWLYPVSTWSSNGFRTVVSLSLSRAKSRRRRVAKI